MHIHVSAVGPDGRPRTNLANDLLAVLDASGAEQLLDLLDLAERVPEARYILAHLVGMPEGDPPVVDEYLDVIKQLCGAWPDNLWAEIRDFDSPGVTSVLARAPHTRLIAGTDRTTRAGPPFPDPGLHTHGRN